MKRKKKLFQVMVTLFIMCLSVSVGLADIAAVSAKKERAKTSRMIVTSDTILSGMVLTLLPPGDFTVESILPPGQCPGHYDIKLSDIEKIKKADLIISFLGMSFLGKSVPKESNQLMLDSQERNWMAPGSYIYGLNLLADKLSERFPEQKAEIMKRKEDAVRGVRIKSDLLIREIKMAGIYGKPVICSDMQQEPLEEMGFRVVGTYQRPEAVSAKNVIRLSKIGKKQNVIAVVDNLQSGPETGKGIAETLGVPHIVLTNFPSENGYLMTLEENVHAILKAGMRK
jgi:zinc transport system substrate-binding protein